MNKLLRIVTLILVSIVCIDISNGAIISRDLFAVDDGLLTYDTVSGREWLDIGVTYGLPVNALPTLLASGNPLEGYTLASLADVESLAISSGFDGIGTTWFGDESGMQNFDVAYSFIDTLWGIYATGELIDELWFTSAILSDGLTEHDYNSVAAIAIAGETIIPGTVNPPLFVRPPTAYISTFHGTFQNYPTNPTLGFWLYRETSVPEPSSITLWIAATIVFWQRAAFTRARIGQLVASNSGSSRRSM